MIGGAQRPFRRVNEPKKTGARSARARTRGQNPLVPYKGTKYHLIYTNTVHMEIQKKKLLCDSHIEN